MRILLVLLLSFNVFASSSDYPEFHLLDQEGKVDYLWSLHLDHKLSPFDLFQAPLDQNELSISSKLRLKTMINSFSAQKSLSLEKVNIEGLSYEEALKIASEWIHYGEIDIQLSEADLILVEKAKAYIKSISQFRSKTKKEIKDLVFNGPNLSDYSQGQYQVKLFLFCRHNREFPCRFILKDRFDQLVRNKDGSLWSMPALAKSSRNLPFYITNGQTPSGIHTMDSVMPHTNRPLEFGYFRRVILNWIPKGKTIELLPSSAHEKKWWKQASLARNNKRKYLRIHGTGRINKDPHSTYYPHVPTAGCVSTREGSYPEQTYTDQRIILDKIMQAQNLAPSFENETEIKGILYVIELDEVEASVDPETLNRYGIN